MEHCKHVRFLPFLSVFKHSALSLYFCSAPASLHRSVPAWVDFPALAIYFWNCPERSPSGLSSFFCKSLLFVWMLVSRHFIYSLCEILFLLLYEFLTTIP